MWQANYLQVGGVVSYLGFGILAAGIGLANTISVVIGDRHGVLYGLAIFAPIIIAIYLFAKYRKWTMQHIIKELIEQGKLIEKNTGER